MNIVANILLCKFFHCDNCFRLVIRFDITFYYKFCFYFVSLFLRENFFFQIVCIQLIHVKIIPVSGHCQSISTCLQRRVNSKYATSEFDTLYREEKKTTERWRKIKIPNKWRLIYTLQLEIVSSWNRYGYLVRCNVCRCQESQPKYYWFYYILLPTVVVIAKQTIL